MQNHIKIILLIIVLLIIVLMTENNIVISKETVQRLLTDVKDLIKEPLNNENIYYIHDDLDMLKGYAIIIGPVDCIYEGGAYFFELIPTTPPIPHIF